MSQRPAPLLAPIALLAALVAPLAAAQSSRDDIPPDLRPWADWALHGHEAMLCPPAADGHFRNCAWSGVLRLDLRDDGGRFEQEWMLLAPAAVPLPGERGRWPLDVTASGRGLAVLESGGRPVVHLDAGRHALSGRFEWSSLPESIAAPTSTPLVDLSVNGKPIPSPRPQPAERIPLEGSARPATDADSLSLAVHRLVTDDVPLFVTTRLLLEIAGAPREIVLGPALPPGAIPVAIRSGLAVQLETDGLLRVQGRPGSWVVELDARMPGPVTELTAPSGENWSPDEVWSFAARPSLRIVAIEGVPSLDPAQTAIPDSWRGLPTFRVGRGETMTFVEKQRGDESPRPDALGVQRSLWLDFDGGGITAQDSLSGELRRSWRLQMQPPHELGHASVGGSDVLLTRMSEGGPSGFEVRQGSAAIVAESRIEGGIREFPAVGWTFDADSLHSVLHLPPGWRLVHATGVDHASDSWIERWSLLDLFLALVVAAAALRLWGAPAAIVALLTLALTIPEGGAPRWSWLFAFALIGIEGLLAEGGRPRRVIHAIRMVFVLGMIAATIPFLVRQSRQALHPQLEQPGYARSSWAPGAMAPQAPDASFEGRAASNAAVLESTTDGPDRAPRPQAPVHLPGEVVQQGPGIPTWTWRFHELRWDGPVAAEHVAHLILQPPAVTRLLSALTVLLACALLLRALAPPKAEMSSFLRRRRRAPPEAAAATSLLLLSLLALLMPPPARAELPSAAHIEQLRARLLERPPCGDACVAISRVRIEARGESILLRMRVDAAADSVVALPAGWMPANVKVDGRASTEMLSNGRGGLLLFVREGSHDVEMSGPAGADSVGLAFPSRPARVDLALDGWAASGVTDGFVSDSLQLLRTREPAAARATPGPSDAATAASLPPFVRVTRTLSMDIIWTAETSLEVLAPATIPVVLSIPLLSGESVTTMGITVEGGEVKVHLAPGQPTLSWRSTLAMADSIELTAATDRGFVEEWRLVASPRWHAEWSGIPPVHQEAAPGDRVPTWRPWPGESVRLAITRPLAAPGSSLVIQSSMLDSRPGRRVADQGLNVTYSASMGGEHVIELPEGTEILSLAQDGQAQPARLDGRQLVLPVLPGMHQWNIQWRDPHVMRGFHRTPQVDFRIPSVNPALSLAVPEHRWILWTSGPMIGPAVLFWPLLAVLILLALGLSRIPGPLKLHDWVLLLIGLSQVHVAAGAIVVTWLIVLAWRRREAEDAPAFVFDLGQIVIVLGAVASVGVLVAAIHQGLLGRPEMQVAGNGSSGSYLAWLGDRADGPMPRGFVLSAPLLVYRIAMLLWALWLAASLVRWMRWAWDAFVQGGAWRRLREPKVPKAPDAHAIPPGPGAA